MKRYNLKSKEKCKQLQDYRVEHATKDAGTTTPMRSSRMLDKSVNALMRESDAKEHEEKVAREVTKER